MSAADFSVTVPPMDLYGTRTSPYVRRVRVVADMVGAALDLIDTSTEDGQQRLRTISPIWKVPVLDNGERAIFDSGVITDYLIRRFGNANIRTESGGGRWRERNVISAIDGALDSAINLFYLKRDGATEVEYMRKQASRMESAMDWVEKQLESSYLTDVPRIGRAEIALFSTLEWMQFRDTYPVARHPGLVDFLQTHRAFPAFASTRPGE